MNQVKLRPWKKSDVASLVKYANNPKITNNMTDGFPKPFTEKEAKAFIKKANLANPCTRFAVLFNDEVAGSIGIHPSQDIHRLNAELGYWLAEDFWGKGIMTEAISYIIKYTFEMLSPVERIFAIPFPTNSPSIRILEKNGFVLEATIKNGIVKNGKKMDELIYAIRKS